MLTGATRRSSLLFIKDPLKKPLRRFHFLNSNYPRQNGAGSVVSSGLLMLPLITHLRRYFASITLGLVVFASSLAGADEGLEHFEKKIRPLLLNQCIACHGPEQEEGGLNLNSKAGWQVGGFLGPAIEPGNTKDSLIAQLLNTPNVFPQHPKLSITEDQIHDLLVWIKLGAPDPRANFVNRESLPNYERGKDHWAFQAIQKPEPPQVKNKSWARGAIDSFILSQQEAEVVTPVRDATPQELVRRVYFALIGLPPTPQQIETFLAEDRPDAFESLIDDLLASPHFGERWGRHWLDVARFAESSGGGRTLLFKDAWRFRDYVIQAFNNDMPFDQFIKEQLAGDLLPYETAEQRSRQLTATAFLALGPTNYEQQDKQLLRYDVIDEQIDTLGKAFMGMTLSCARCHDHKFDPIPTADYYAMAGIFKSTRTLYNYTDNVARWIDSKLPLDGPAGEKLAETEAKADALNWELSLLRTELAILDQKSKKPPKPGKPASQRLFPGIILNDDSATKTGTWLFSQYSQNYIGEGYQHDGNAAKGSSTLSFDTIIPFDGLYEVRIAYSEATSRSTNTPITIAHADGETGILLDQRIAPDVHGRFRSLGQFYFNKGVSYTLTVSNKDTDGYVVVDAVQWERIESTEEASSAERSEHIDLVNSDLQLIGKELKPLTEILKRRPLAMTVLDDTHVSDSAIRIRGEVHRKGKIVPRGFLKVATQGELPSLPDDSSGRLELAEWLISPEHPLTSRVIANRIWTWLFGTGLVQSTDNFGTTGLGPSHPELLDYLAIRLQENGWSTKAMIKEILMSRTWQLATEVNPEAKQLDADNRLLTSFPLRRLDAEQLRDAILAVNGNLDLQLYGPNIDGAGIINANSTAAQKIEYNYLFEDTRRSVYTPAFRVKRHELFELFDFRNANFSIGQRNVSTVALQALYMLNNPFVIEQSRKAAEVLLDEVTPKEQRLERAFIKTLGRPPTEQEAALVNQHLGDGLSNDSVEDWASVFQTLFGSIDFRYIN